MANQDLKCRPVYYRSAPERIGQKLIKPRAAELIPSPRKLLRSAPPSAYVTNDPPHRVIQTVLARSADWNPHAYGGASKSPESRFQARRTDASAYL